MYSDMVKAGNTIFDAWYPDEITDLNVSDEKMIHFKKKSFQLVSNKKEDLINYANLCQLRSFNLKYSLVRIETVAERAEKLPALLKEECRLQ